MPDLDLPAPGSPEPDLEVIVGDDDGDLTRTTRMTTMTGSCLMSRPTPSTTPSPSCWRPARPPSRPRRGADRPGPPAARTPSPTKPPTSSISCCWTCPASGSTTGIGGPDRPTCSRAGPSPTAHGADLRSGGLEAEPDLAALGMRVQTPRRWPTAPELAAPKTPTPAGIGYVGPPGWLHNRQQGDLVALRFSRRPLVAGSGDPSRATARPRPRHAAGRARAGHRRRVGATSCCARCSMR